MPDNIHLVCIECSKNFYFSAKDQEWYAEQGFAAPRRCWACRQKRKQEALLSMKKQSTEK
jgi:hypothetical protein